MERMHEGILSQDQHKRYCLYEPGVPEYKRLTCTSGCRLEIWLNRAWIAGHVEGDGEDYWLFADGGGRFLLAERMKARSIEHHWRSNMRDISGICSSSSIRIMRQKWWIYGISNSQPGQCIQQDLRVFKDGAKRVATVSAQDGEPDINCNEARP